MDEEPSGTGVEPEQGQIRTFLIADVRGWTLFTQQRVDEVAAKLAAKFAGIAREGVDPAERLQAALPAPEAAQRRPVERIPSSPRRSRSPSR